MQLSWNDLIIENIDPALAKRCLDEWQFILSGDCAPIFISKFGDWFLQRKDGSIDELSVIEGEVTPVARNFDEFRMLMNSVDWQEEHLLSRLIYELHLRSIVPGDGECYAIAPHPIFSGKIEVENILVMSLPVWQSICAQTFSPSTEAEP